MTNVKEERKKERQKVFFCIMITNVIVSFSIDDPCERRKGAHHCDFQLFSLGLVSHTSIISVNICGSLFE